MDFAYRETQTMVRDLSRKIFDDRVTQRSLRAVEAEPDRFDRRLWSDLAAAGLLGAAIAEADGGSGHGLLELCALLEQAGAAVAPVPLWPTLVLGALPIGEHGTPEQRRLLAGVCAGETILTAALIEPASHDALRPQARARADGKGWILDGTKSCVPAAHLAKKILVPATTEDERVVIVLVDPRAGGVTMREQTATTGDPLRLVELSGVRASADDVLVGPDGGDAALARLVDQATVTLCAMELGVAERALRMTAAYTTSRHQFERPIATFQAVGQRAADAYIDVETIRLATWQAAWRLSEGLPAAAAIAVAKYWAAEAGHRVVYAAQHLHGGIGFDRDYPLHRYYTLSRQIELTLGGATLQLERLGAALAEDERS